MNKLNLTRKELYDLVWEKPINYIIENYGGSYQGVKEMLAKYNIPYPENGYWSKLRSGHQVQQVELPQDRDSSEKIVYEPREKHKRIKVINHPMVEDQNVQTIPKKDKLIIEAEKIFRKQLNGRNNAGLIGIAYESLDITVSAKSIDRTLSFFNLLIAGVKRMGGIFKVEPHKTKVEYDGEEVIMSLREKQNRIENKNPQRSWETYEYVPSGILYFKIGEHSWRSKEWKDTAYTVIEDKIDDILAHIKTTVRAIKEDRIEQELRRVEEAKKRQLQEDLEKRQSNELKKFIELKTNAELWEKAVLMRNYLIALENTVKAEGRFDTDMQAYLSWAREKADWYDPLVEIDDDLLKSVDKITLTLPKKWHW